MVRNCHGSTFDLYCPSVVGAVMGMQSRSKMTGWYDPLRLISIGIRVTEATVFGKLFDRRELIASLDPFDRPDFDANCDFSSALHIAAVLVRFLRRHRRRLVARPCRLQ